MICYDREFPESARILMLKGAEIILTPNCCELEQSRLGQFRTRAFENMVGVAMANYAAPQDNRGGGVRGAGSDLAAQRQNSSRPPARRAPRNGNSLQELASIERSRRSMARYRRRERAETWISLQFAVALQGLTPFPGGDTRLYLGPSRSADLLSSRSCVTTARSW